MKKKIYGIGLFLLYIFCYVAFLKRYPLKTTLIVIGMITLFGIAILIRKKIWNKKQIIQAICLSLLGCFFLPYDLYQSTRFSSHPVLFYLGMAIVSFFVFFVLIYLLLLYSKDNRWIDRAEKKKKYMVVLFFLIPFITIGIHWIMNFPAHLSYDSYVQLEQIANNAYYDVHPAAHTLFCKLLMQLYNSPATVIFFQIFLLSIITMLSFSYLYQKGVSNRLLLPILIIWSCLLPIRDVTIYLWKDVFYGVALLTLTYLLMKMVIDKGKVTIWDTALGIVSLSMVYLFRGNGFIPFVAVAMVYIFFAVKYNKKYIIALGGTIVLIVLIKTVVYGHYEVVPSYNGTKLGLPAKAVVSVIPYEGNYTKEELEKIENLIPKELILKNYNWKHGETFLHYELKNEEGIDCAFSANLYGKEKAVLELFFSLLPKNLGIMFWDFWGSSALMLQFQLEQDFLSHHMAYFFILLICCVAILLKKEEKQPKSKIRKWGKLVPFIPMIANSISMIISNISYESRYAYPTILCFAVLMMYTYYQLNEKEEIENGKEKNI